MDSRNLVNFITEVRLVDLVSLFCREALFEKKHDSGGQNANKGKLAKREAYLITGFDIKLSFSISS